MRAGDSMNLFPLALLVKRDGPQDGSQNHARTMNPGQSLVQADGPARHGARNSWRKDRKISSGEVQARRHRTQRRMQVPGSRAGALAPGEAPCEERGDQGNGRDQPQPLMNLEHVRPLVESGLILGVSLSLIDWKAQISHGRRSWI